MSEKSWERFPTLSNARNGLKGAAAPESVDCYESFQTEGRSFVADATGHALALGRQPRLVNGDLQNNRKDHRAVRTPAQHGATRASQMVGSVY